MHNLRCINDSFTKLKAVVCKIAARLLRCDAVTNPLVLGFGERSFFDQIMFVSIGALVDDFVRVGLGDAGQSE